MANTFRSPRLAQNIRNATPSISPLSSTSKTNNDSAVSPTPAEQIHPNGRKEQDAMDMDEGSRSSSLSEIEDDAAGSEQGQSDSDGALTPAPEPEDDSEAETERIKPTPHKAGNPAKMSLIAPLPSVVEDPTSETASHFDSDDRETGRLPMSKRTKRLSNEKTDQDAYSFSVRKRKRPLQRHDSNAARSGDSDSENATTKRRETRRSMPRSHGPDGHAGKGDTIRNSTLGVDRESALIGRRSAGRAESIQEDAIDEGLPGGTEVVQIPEVEEPEPDGVGADEEGEQETIVELSLEEVELRNNGATKVQGIQGIFGKLRARTHGDRISEAAQELRDLQSGLGSHPEYVRQLQAISARRDAKIQQEMKLHAYKKQTLRTRVLASRSQLLSQYLQDARDVRERVLYVLGKEWYDIQKERRAAQADELERYGQVFPTSRSEQLRQQAKYNQEVSVLSGIAKYVGFPAAPEITGTKQTDTDEDMKAMRITRKPPLHFATTMTITPRMPDNTASEQMAHKDFLEQTPWANPHHPVHTQSRTPTGYGPTLFDTTQSTPAFSLIGRRSPGPTTPHVNGSGTIGREQRMPGSNETVGVSVGPSSVIAAPATTDRIRLAAYDHGELSPTAHFRQPMASKRDFSGVSSASTIDMMPSDPLNPSEHRVQLTRDVMPSNQPFVTSGLHG